MSTKNNLLVAAAALALGVTVAANASPICEGLLNDLSITQFGVAEVDTTGRVMVIVETTVGGVVTVRPVADSSGNVRVYAGADSALALSKRASLAQGVTVRFVKMAPSYSVGDPIAALKAKYKRFKSEAANSLKQSATLASKVTGAEALGWDTAVGTPENTEYSDLVSRQVSLLEWKDFNDEKVVSLAASLTAAGIDPLTVV